MENLIKLHKSQLASDRTSCRAPLANQMRLILHTAAYWLMLELRDAIPKTHPLAVAEFVTLREKLLKIGARIVETASRIKLALTSACPQARLFRHLAGALQPAGPSATGQRQCPHAPDHPSIQLQRVPKVPVDTAEKTQRGIASAIMSRTKSAMCVGWVNKTG